MLVYYLHILYTVHISHHKLTAYMLSGSDSVYYEIQSCYENYNDENYNICTSENLLSSLVSYTHKHSLGVIIIIITKNYAVFSKYNAAK